MNRSDRLNNIILFTKDKPALEGSGKSIRLMNWLAHLSREYVKIYCIYFYQEIKLDSDIGIDYPSNVEFIPIQLIRPGTGTALWRRVMPFNANRYSLFWYMDISASDQDLIAKLFTQSPDILFFRLYLYPVLHLFMNRISKQSKVYLDIDDVESDTFRKILQAQRTRGNYKEWFSTWLGYHYMKQYEKSIHPLIDTLYYANPLDYDNLKTLFSKTNLACFPNKVIHQTLEENQHQEENVSILFSGALNYFPNVDAVHFLVKDIWPIILKAIPSARLTIAGSHPDHTIKQLIASLPSAGLISDPISMKDVFRKAAIILVPLRIGGGTRIKILQAFSYGIPVVSTTVGISGIEAIDGEEVIIKDKAIEMAQAAIELLLHVSLRRSLSLKAYDLFKKHYSFNLNS